MSEELFSIGKEYSISGMGKIYVKGQRMENEFHIVDLHSVSFETIHRNDIVLRCIVIGIRDFKNICYKHIMFDENSKYFNNLTWEEYKESIKTFLCEYHRWFFKNTEMYYM